MNDCGINVGMRRWNGEVEVVSFPETSDAKEMETYLSQFKGKWPIRNNVFKGRTVTVYSSEQSWLEQLSSEWVTDAFVWKYGHWYYASAENDWAKFYRI